MIDHANSCPVCRNDLKENSIGTDDYGNISYIDCRYCGKYQLFGWRVKTRYGLGKNQDSSRKTADPILSIAIRLEYEKTKKEVFVDDKTITDLKNSVIEPESPLEKVDLLLLYLHQRNHDNTKAFVIPVYDYPLVYARSVEELDTIYGFAKELEFVQILASENKTLRKCIITKKGWLRLDTLKSMNKELIKDPYTSNLSRGLKCFIVHGQDTWRRNQLKKYLISIGITPIILHEQPSRGKTIVEKFEFYSETADLAICLWTGDDQGCKKGEKALCDRARQNVILETGYFWGTLERKKIIVLYSDNVDIPSDFKGLVYVAWNKKTWRDDLRKEIENMAF